MEPGFNPKIFAQMKLIGPVSDFEKRTKKHISLVMKYGNILSQYLESKNEKDRALKLLKDVSVHDASKFTEDEKKGYIWINAHYNLGYDYPNKNIRKMADDAWKHHKSINNHHPEFWSNCNDMPRYVIAHMVADWKGMESINEKSMKIKEFWKTIGSIKYDWDKEHISWIKEFMDYLQNR